jgi:YjbE family integral membrane protein
MDTEAFLTTLLAIIVIDLVLAGDNAIVIALAARALPAHLQKRAIIWGAVGAIGVRTLMTVAVVWLLKIPGLLLLGGAMLVWIGYGLLLPDESQGEAHKPAAATFWGAMRTIVVADAVMGLDNVLAVAGAAHGSYLLVVVGLIISVPIVVWGSTLVLKLVERYPGVVYLGAGVLVWTAVKMIVAEPLLKPWVQDAPLAAALLFLAVPMVLWAGFVKNHRKLESRIHARLAEFRTRHPRGAGLAPSIHQRSVSTSHQGEKAVLKVLIPIDASANALRALKHAVAEYQRHHELELHLLNVQPALSRHVARFINRHDRDAWHQEQAEAAMADAKALLAEAGVPHQSHWSIGERAREICLAAERLGAHHIVMGTARKNSITRMLEDSVTNRVLENTPVPVEVVAGEAVSKWERWGLPAGVFGLGGGLLWLALE